MSIPTPRDARWYANYNQGLTSLNMSEEVAVKWADASWRVNANYKRYELQKEARSIKVIPNKAEPRAGGGAAMMKMCKATLMSGKGCSYKAACGDFCKRHRMLDLNVVKK